VDAQPRLSAPLPLFPIRAVWTLDLNNPLLAPPAFNAGRAYFAIGNDRLVAYDLVVGTERWMVSAHLDSEPAVGDGLVFIAEPHALAALAERDGSVVWRLPFDGTLAVPLVWDNGWLIAVDATGTVYAYRAADGELIWQYAIGARAHAPPALAADRVYVPVGDGRIVALRVDTGQLLWGRRLGGAPNEIRALDDRLYVGSTDKFFYCLNSDSGEIAWRWRTGGDVIGVPVVDERRVYFISLDNILRALDRKTGNQLWKRALPVRPLAGPERVMDTLIVAGLTPTLRAFRMTDGSPAGDIPVRGELAAQPHVVSSSDMSVPLVVILTRDLAKGTTATAVAHTFEPPILPIAPLPNLIPMSSSRPVAAPPTR
jgi:PQQ-like domain